MKKISALKSTAIAATPMSLAVTALVAFVATLTILTLVLVIALVVIAVRGKRAGKPKGWSKQTPARADRRRKPDTARG